MIYRTVVCKWVGLSVIYQSTEVLQTCNKTETFLTELVIINGQQSTTYSTESTFYTSISNEGFSPIFLFSTIVCGLHFMVPLEMIPLCTRPMHRCMCTTVLCLLKRTSCSSCVFVIVFAKFIIFWTKIRLSWRWKPPHRKAQLQVTAVQQEPDQTILAHVSKQVKPIHRHGHYPILQIRKTSWSVWTQCSTIFNKRIKVNISH